MLMMLTLADHPTLTSACQCIFCLGGPVSASSNRKLLVSVYNAQEAREAILGGGRIIDSEDPSTALGNIKPQRIMDISDAVLDFRRDESIQLSTNIGEDQLLFRRSDTGQAIQKGDDEIAGKAAQAAMGVATAMGTRVHPAAIVKVGLDGMPQALLQQCLQEVVQTLRRTEHLSHTRVMSVLFAQDLDAWATRKAMPHYQRKLVEAREFSVGDSSGAVLSQPILAALIKEGVLPEQAQESKITLNELFPHSHFMPQATEPRTTRAVIEAMVAASADAGAYGIMLDTSILSKTCDICLFDTRGDEVPDFNALYQSGKGLPRQGILTLEDIRFFVQCCHAHGLVANLAGSIDSYQAQMLWALLPDLDQLSTRGAASGTPVAPLQTCDEAAASGRRDRVIRASLVRGLAPPEQGGVLNLPASFKSDPAKQALIGQVQALIAHHRRAAALPELRTCWVNPCGVAQAA
jgi:uncharacterized protein (UPF0264 family)